MAPNGRDAIVAAAERLIALRGVEVPLRDIAVAAGHRNNSAVQYHFASREDLVVAVIEHRAPVLEARRLERLVAVERAGRGSEPRSLVGALVVPLLDGPLVDGDWHYARFLEQVRTLPGALDRPALDTHRASVALILGRLEGAMPAMPKRGREARIDVFGTTLFALAAAHERWLEAGTRSKAARDVAEAAILDALAAVVLGPAG